ncbi:tRNA 4-thiouridine(8) synthase ThiI [Candidatus Woesearchaeota archaeon]|jgi:thiamine biosynthesis protein ThiI|nr:tRNA 4-thiouridine(8) synthase ThiI [Candidatus Woesearchaeota archaeon]MBT3438597.1 tRNA 4-thiouridine(8) synthase ThiI [Candidatus Woesearchaeota archaeon]MBT4058505.1 tRNA 4-thiouridine(8) synthase ThiI [Candidatus Woesearchaeota archaeon]MBT4207282.1 tRNA 4-thiouridine(8) synthase ThiI [Candidatus Woesearchaeota archaeon]MBT4733196.1 tRNA 4-thiouridine(8) synthase ThiI [Candidatus Woesearchaeota archaeon]
MKPDCFVVHYAEIAIKGKNRPLFERILIENIRKSIKGLKALGVRRRYGRLIVELKEDSKLEEIEEKLKKIPGISSFSPALKTNHDLDKIKDASLILMQEATETSFYIKVKRSYKKFPLKSMEISKEVGTHLGKVKGKIVDFVTPEITLFIEIVENGAYVYTKKVKGIGGLPVSVSGKVMVLLSGGIDSPVAAYLTLKRGCKNIYVHFHSEPYTKESSRKKVEELARQIAEHQNETKIFMVPLIDIQKEVMTKTDKKYRIILYRRFMFRIAEALARKSKAKALVTGENLGQVASQTIENIHAIHSTINMPVIQPLITFDKQEIINLAEKIGTYKKSIEPHDDCCSLFVPKHPATKSDINIVISEESKLDVETLVRDALKKTEKVSINNPDN